MSIAQSVHGLTAPFLIGTALSTFLCGVTLAQCCTYFTTFRNDRLIFRLSVAILMLIDLTHTALCQFTLWLWFVIHFGEPTEVTWAPWSFAVSPVLCGVATLVVQLFYAYRLWLITKHHPLIPSLITFGSLWQLGWSAGATRQVFVLKYFADFHYWTYGVACWLGGAAANDLLITSSLLWVLISSKTKYSRPNSIIDRLIALTIETNGLTFTIALLDLLMFAALDGAYHIIPNLCIIKLYINSFLISLNSRKQSPIREERMKESTAGYESQSTSSRGNQMGISTFFESDQVQLKGFVKLDPINTPTTDKFSLVINGHQNEIGVSCKKHDIGTIE